VRRGADITSTGAVARGTTGWPCWNQGSKVLEGDRQQLLSRIVNLTTLAPDIVVTILADALPHITLFDQAVNTSALQDEQREQPGLPR
jgi:hypothetical protein